MPIDFKPLRRKIGVITLVMACVVMIAWMRSLWVADWVEFCSGSSTMEHCISVDHAIVWSRMHVEDFELMTITTFHLVRLDRFTTVDDFLNRNRLRCWWRGCGFGIGESTAPISEDFDRGYWETFWIIPYWSIILPLTLLSAWLLLSKPRVGKTVVS